MWLLQSQNQIGAPHNDFLTLHYRSMAIGRQNFPSATMLCRIQDPCLIKLQIFSEVKRLVFSEFLIICYFSLKHCFLLRQKVLLAEALFYFLHSNIIFYILSTAETETTICILWGSHCFFSVSAVWHCTFWSLTSSLSPSTPLCKLSALYKIVAVYYWDFSAFSEDYPCCAV